MNNLHSTAYVRTRLRYHNILPHRGGGLFQMSGLWKRITGTRQHVEMSNPKRKSAYCFQ